ncbi:N-acetylglucosaminyl-diphospho-decaprenol L-rhamnosyltransferase [mine drainage metagenome]|uniref:N-acetylglucosaminyl-diphospho-decaprenol L-rhamnosyltransferase n=1 Tax=mine drainage metagenome TaxID=410659 RepID=A0A1J5SVX2_9ZZZZ
MKKVSIITVNFNHSHITEELLISVAKENQYPNIEIIVVDNGSKINPLPEWEEKYPHVIFIRSEKNLGFAGGNNIGIKAAKGDYLFFVNNDTEFTEGLIDKLVDTLDKNKNVAVVSPKIKYFDQPQMLQYVGYTEMNYFTARNKQLGQFEKDNGQYDNIIAKTGFAHGAAMMVKREAIDKAGTMAENFFLYYEEMDWCDHIKHAGYEIWVNTNALIFHKESVSVGKKSALKEYFMNRNRILFIRRNAPFFKRYIFYFYFVLVVAPRNIITYIKSGDTNFIKMLLKAIWWNITNKTTSTYLGYTLK